MSAPARNLKEEWSWILVDVGNSAFATTILAAVFPIYLPSLLPQEGVQLSIFGWEWTTSAIALWGYTVSFSLFITLILSPLLGAWADQAGKRKHLFALFTILGCLGTAGLGFTTDWKIALLSFVIGNIGFSASIVFNNALLQHVTTENHYDALSLKGFAWGYIGGGILLLLNLIMIMKFEWLGIPSKQAGLQLSFLSVSVWWILFSLPAILFIDESRRRLSRAEQKLLGPSTGPLHGPLTRAFEFLRTVKSLPRYPSLLLFILAFAFFNDGISTVISMASIYGKEALQLSEEVLIGTLLIIQFFGLPFTLGMTKLTKRFGTKQTLIGALVLWMAIILYAFEMKTSAQFFGLGLAVALVLGVSQALPRSIFAKLTPVGREAEFFSLFAISGKMTAMMGPFVFGAVKDLTGDSRFSILTLGIFFVIGLALLCFVKIPAHRPSS